MLDWLLLVAAVEIESDSMLSVSEKTSYLEACMAIIEKWKGAAERSKYQVEKLLEAVKE